MLPVQSPVPLEEGESIGYGISTKHLMNFFIGVAAGAPIGVVVWIILVVYAKPGWIAFIPVGVIGVAFAILQVQQRTLAEYCWLSLRFKLRPKVWFYKRAYRVARHREGDELS